MRLAVKTSPEGSRSGATGSAGLAMVQDQILRGAVAGELSEKLDVDLSLSFDRLFAADLSGRARAFQSLVGGGMDSGEAAALAGLMESDG